MKKTVLYVLQFDTGIKIGITNNLKHRLTSYDRPLCKPIRFGVVYPDFSNPKLVEKEVKSNLRSHCKSNSPEYFQDIKFKEVLRNIREVAKSNELWLAQYSPNKLKNRMNMERIKIKS